MANALSDQFVVSIEKKSAEWKVRVGELERKRCRALKKAKQQKKSAIGGDGNESAMEARNRYVELLQEQRAQFVFFVNALLPILVSRLTLP